MPATLLLLMIALPPLHHLDRLGDRIDPAHPRPDLAALEELRRVCREESAAGLRRLAGGAPVSAPSRGAAVLASAWGRDCDEAHVRWLVAVALAGDPRAGQAAVHALVHAGETQALEEVVTFALPRDDTHARVALALDQLPAVPPDLALAWLRAARARPRVEAAAWGLVQRSDPEFGWRYGIDQPGAMAWLTDLARLEELCFHSSDWVRRAAYRALVANGSVQARRWILIALETNDPVQRSGVQAGLRTWRPWPGHPPALGLFELLGQLEEPERNLLQESLWDRWTRWEWCLHHDAEPAVVLDAARGALERANLPAQLRERWLGRIADWRRAAARGG